MNTALPIFDHLVQRAAPPLISLPRPITTLTTLLRLMQACLPRQAYRYFLSSVYRLLLRMLSSINFEARAIHRKIYGNWTSADNYTTTC